MANIAISAEWFANLSRYMEQLQADTTAAAENAVSFLQDRVVEKARDTPEWSDLADEITVWSQDGYLFLGVNNQDRVSEAMALEYGDEVRPPSALFRSLSEDVRNANQRWQEEMESKGYTYGAGIVGQPL
jgi:hypothetical protein